MQVQHRRNWLRKVQQIIRSRHYSWIAEARDGEPPHRVLADVATDVMHICKRQGIPIDDLLRQSRAQFEKEEGMAEGT